ncbi:MAG: hypothetical protein M1813_001625 [Trichoglossum hirsutum]|nr:MAG: hypothetical protein M1813_001625 [Trichoglossum hirsutum]
MKHITNRLKALGHIIMEICKISGVSGVSLGVLHRGEVIHNANFGFRDFSNLSPPNETTTFVIGSLTKAVTAAMIGMLVDDGKLHWDTNLHDVFPEFRRDEIDPTSKTTISDLLSHQTGLFAQDGLWLASDNRVYLERTQAVPILSYTPVSKPIRTDFIYNNFAYEVLGQVIEKLSGTPYATFLRDRILEPLNMTRTFYTNPPSDDGNTAKPYVSLEDGSPFEIPPPLYGEDALMGSAGGIRSCVKDLLILYKAFIEAGISQIEHGPPPSPNNPLKQLQHLWRGTISMPSISLREHSYASGWVRAQLPSIMDMDGSAIAGPIVGMGKPSRLALYHQGNIPGFATFCAVFPETESAVVVLTNSMALNDAVKWIGELLIENLFDNNVDPNIYVELSKTTAEMGASVMSDILKELTDSRTVKHPLRRPHAYTGRYYNSIRNFFIDILYEDGELRISFMGHGLDSFSLEPYQEDSFFWNMTHNEIVRRGRYTDFPKEYYIVKFGCNGKGGAAERADSEMNCLWWKHEEDLPGDGEIFQKSNVSLFQDQESQRILSNVSAG